MSNTVDSNVSAVMGRGLVRRYERGRVAALAGVDLEIARGEWVAICGPSGCGKSTLLNVLAAIDAPDEGEIVVCGKTINRLSESEATAHRRDSIGLVFQLHNLLPRLTAIENVQIPALASKMPRAERVSRAAELLRLVGLEHRLSAAAPTLSGGERQRVAICRALINRPTILLADEPTGALDSRSGSQIMEVFEKLRREMHMTLIIVTHDSTVASRAERVLHMLDGRIVA